MKLKLLTLIMSLNLVTTLTYTDDRNWLVGIVNQTSYTLFIRTHDRSGMTFSQNFDIGGITKHMSINWGFYPSRGDMYELGPNRMCFLKETPIPWASYGEDNRIFVNVGGGARPYTGFNIQERNERGIIYRREIGHAPAGRTYVIDHYDDYNGRFVAMKQSGKNPSDPAFSYFQVEGKHAVNEHNVPLRTGEEYVLIVRQNPDKMIVLNIRPLSTSEKNCSGLPCTLPTKPMYWTENTFNNPASNYSQFEE